MPDEFWTPLARPTIEDSKLCREQYSADNGPSSLPHRDPSFPLDPGIKDLGTKGMTPAALLHFSFDVSGADVHDGVTKQA